MKHRMDKTLEFWVECELQDQPDCPSVDPEQVIIRILCEWEEYGDAMRGLDKRGRLCWKASPQMLERLADQEQEARDELRDN